MTPFGFKFGHPSAQKWEGKAGKAREVVKTYQFLEKGCCWMSHAFERIMLRLAVSTKNDVSYKKKIKDQSHQSLPQQLRTLRTEPKGKPI